MKPLRGLQETRVATREEIGPRGPPAAAAHPDLILLGCEWMWGSNFTPPQDSRAVVEVRRRRGAGGRRLVVVKTPSSLLARPPALIRSP